MKVTKIAFEKTIGMPNYSNDKPIVVECILEGDETKEQAWSKLNQDMISWHKKEYPHLYNVGMDVPSFPLMIHPPENPRLQLVPEEPIIRSKQPPAERLALLIADISSCVDVKILESYRIMAKGHPDLQAAYDAQLIKLAEK